MNTYAKVGGGALRHKMQSHQLRFTCVWQTQNETLLKNCSCGAWRACQLTLVRFKLRANKDVLLGICVHDSQAEREALISYGARAKGIIARGDQPQTWAEREKKFKYCWSSRLFEKIKACTPHNLWFDILRSNREISQGLTKQTTLKKHSNKKKSVDCCHQQCRHVKHDDRDLFGISGNHNTCNWFRVSNWRAMNKWLLLSVYHRISLFFCW